MLWNRKIWLLNAKIIPLKQKNFQIMKTNFTEKYRISVIWIEFLFLCPEDIMKKKKNENYTNS